MSILRRRQFGDPVLRSVAEELSREDINSVRIQTLIKDMQTTLEEKKYGVGIAAPQVGQSVALSVIAIKPTPTRPQLKREELIVINPVVTKTYGAKAPMWEGCISGPELYAQVPRYKKLRVKWLDARANEHEEDFEGFMAHVLQHEIDHLSGLLFVDNVKDTRSYMTFSEYKKMKKRES